MTMTLIQVDARKRLSLGALGTADQYLAHTEEDGRIILEPAVIMTKAERAFFADPRVIADLAAADPSKPQADWVEPPARRRR